jgi:hypothetical protein
MRQGTLQDLCRDFKGNLRKIHRENNGRDIIWCEPLWAKPKRFTRMMSMFKGGGLSLFSQGKDMGVANAMKGGETVVDTQKKGFWRKASSVFKTGAILGAKSKSPKKGGVHDHFPPSHDDGFAQADMALLEKKKAKMNGGLPVSGKNSKQPSIGTGFMGFREGEKAVDAVEAATTAKDPCGGRLSLTAQSITVNKSAMDEVEFCGGLSLRNHVPRPTRKMCVTLHDFRSDGQQYRDLAQFGESAVGNHNFLCTDTAILFPLADEQKRFLSCNGFIQWSAWFGAPKEPSVRGDSNIILTDVITMGIVI